MREKAMRVRIRGGVDIEVPSDLSLMTPFVLLEQEDWFEAEVAFVRRMLLPGMTVVDVGANYGIYSLVSASLVGSDGKVIAFEPASSTADYLTRSMQLNGFENVRLFRCALSDHSGETSLFLSDNSELNSLQPTKGGRTETVLLRTLDDCLEEAGVTVPDFVKLDAEGEEARVLCGAERLLANASPLCMFELKHGKQVNTELLAAFKQRGYDLYSLMPGLNVLVPFDTRASLDSFQLNLFACKPARVLVLRERGLLATVEDMQAILPTPAGDACWTYLAELLCFRNYVSGWTRTLEHESSDITAYLAVLSDYACAHAKATISSHRPAYLARAYKSLFAMVDGKLAGFTQLSTLARIATEMGQREIAARILIMLLGAVHRKQLNVLLDQPFLPACARFEGVDCGDDLGGWAFASVQEAAVRCSAFSSYFAKRGMLPILDALSSGPYCSPEIERRRQLLRLQSGAQSLPVSHPVLSRSSVDNLNSWYWSNSGN
jgi:FkbM family methyltransferase